MAKPMAAGSATAAAKRRSGMRAEQDGREHQQQKDDQRGVAGDRQLGQRQQRGQAHAAHGVSQRRAGGHGRHDHEIRVRRNMVSVSDCSTVTSGARLGSGSVASAVPKSSAKMAT